jgi:hypothetical protein
MRLISLLTLSGVCLCNALAMKKPSFHTQGTPTGALKPGQYWWKPELSQNGPVVVLVSVPQQVKSCTFIATAF